MSTASTTVPWPCPSSSCYPRSTRRLEAQGPRPSWTVPPFAVPASDLAPPSLEPVHRKPLPSPVSLPERGLLSCPTPSTQEKRLSSEPERSLGIWGAPDECFLRAQLLGFHIMPEREELPPSSSSTVMTNVVSAEAWSQRVSPHLPFPPHPKVSAQPQPQRGSAHAPSSHRFLLETPLLSCALRL